MKPELKCDRCKTPITKDSGALVYIAQCGQPYYKLIAYCTCDDCYNQLRKEYLSQNSIEGSPTNWYITKEPLKNLQTPEQFLAYLLLLIVLLNENKTQFSPVALEKLLTVLAEMSQYALREPTSVEEEIREMLKLIVL